MLADKYNDLESLVISLFVESWYQHWFVSKKLLSLLVEYFVKIWELMLYLKTDYLNITIQYEKKGMNVYQTSCFFCQTYN